MKHRIILFSLLLLAMLYAVPVRARAESIVTQLQFGRQTVTVPADGELVFYDFKGADMISSNSSNNQHSLTVFKPEVEGMSVQVTFENIDIQNDGSSYPGKVLVYSGDPDPENKFSWASTTLGVNVSTLMPDGDVMATLDGVYSGLTYYSTASDGSLGVGVLWRYAKACDGWTAKVKCVNLTNMHVTGAGSAYGNIQVSPKSKKDVLLAQVYVDTDGVLSADRLKEVRFSLPVNEGVVDPAAIRLYEGGSDGVKDLTPVESTVAADGSGYKLVLDRPLSSGHNVYTFVADISGMAKVGAKVRLEIAGVATEAYPGGVAPFVKEDAVDVENPAIVCMVSGNQTIYVDETPLSFYDDGGVDGDATSKFSGVTTFLPSTEGKKVQIKFDKMQVANGSIYWQYVNVYDGSEVKPEKLIMRVKNGETPLIHSSSADGALTVEMGDNGTTQTGVGFEATVSLFEPQPMELEAVAMTGTSEDTMRAGALMQPMALINLRTVNTEPTLSLSSLKISTVAGAQGLVSNAYLTTATSTPRVLATATESNGVITFDLTEPLTLKEYDNTFMVLIDVSDKAVNDQEINLTVSSVTLNGVEHNGAEQNVSRKIYNKLVADAGTQDVTIYGSWEVSNKPSEYSYYGYDDISGDQIMIIRPGVDGTAIQLTFSTLSLKFPSYYGTKPVFKVVNGAGTSGEVLFEATSSNQSELIGKKINSTDASGALTIVFCTNGNRGTSTSNGFKATAVPYKSQKMVLLGAEAVQAATRDLYADDVEEEILRLKLTTEGAESALTLDELILDLKGCEQWVKSVKLISSGSNSEYVQPVTVWAEAPAAATVTLRPSEELNHLPENASYYWIAFDMKDKLANGHEVDAKITSLKIGNKDVEVQNPDPEGTRLTRNIYKFHGDDVVVVDEPLLFYDNGGPYAFYTRDYTGSVVFKPADPSQAIRIHFNGFDTGYNDELYIYNGSGTDEANQLIKLFGDKAQPRDLASSSSDGALTAYFRTGAYGLTSDGWEILVETFTPQPLTVEKVTPAACAPAQVYAGSCDNEMMHLMVDVVGERGDFNLSGLVFDIAGTSVADIAAAKVWSTGTESSFVRASQIGETIIPDDGATQLRFAGKYNFPHAGTYHFWLTYDVAPEAETGQQLKATFESLTVNDQSITDESEVVASTTLREGMHGDYVIGYSDKADYKTFADAIRDLDNKGVNGPVNMLIEDGTYDEAFTFKPVPGASNLNRITFRSQNGNRDKVVIRYGVEDEALSSGVVNFEDGASYITLKGVTVTSPANKCDGLVMLVGGCYHNTIDDCVIKGHTAASYEERVVLVYTYYLEEPDKNCNYFTLSNSRLEGGFYGLSATGITNLNFPMMIHDVTVTGNTFLNQSGKALLAMGVENGLTIRGNRFMNDGAVMTTDYRNMDIYRCDGDVVIADNLIDVTADQMYNYGTLTGESMANGIYIRDISSARPSVKRIYNNDIRMNGADGTRHTLHGIFVNDNLPEIQTAEIAYNTIVISGAANNYSSTYMMTSSMAGSSVVNNVLQNQAGGPLLRGTVQAKLSDMTISDNALWTTGNAWAMTPSDCTSFEAAVEAIAQPLGIAEQADFLAENMHELKSAGNLMSAKPVDYITADLLGNHRSLTTPTMGAYEFTDQSGTPAWSEGYPKVEGITVNSAMLSLSADKASMARCIVQKADAVAPAAEDFDGCEAVALHTLKPSIVTLSDLEENTQYKVYVKLVSYLGVEAAEVAVVDFTTLSSEPVYPNPVAEITTRDVTSGNEGEKLQLSGKGSGGMEPLSYKWTDQEGNVLSSTTDVTVDLTHSMTYRFTVTDNRGKEAFEEINIEVRGKQYVATFEDLKLDSESYWGGNNTNEPFYSGSFAFDYYHGGSGSYEYWGHFTYSNLTSTAFNNMKDQYNSAVGCGVDGSATYGVAYLDSYVGATYLTVTNRAEGDIIPGMWLTNSAWVMKAVKEGDGLSTVPGGFAKDDYYKVTITGLLNAKTVGTVEFYLADYRAELEQDRYALDTWQWVDLSSLGEVNKLWLRVDGTKQNSFGITTPLYLCLDNVGDECPWKDATPQTVTILDNADGTLDLNPIFSLDPTVATISYFVEGGEDAVRLDDQNPGLLTIDGNAPEGEMTLQVKATQQGRSSYLRVPLTINQQSGLHKVTAEAVKVYPQPAHDVLNISTDLTGYSAGLYDMQGRRVLKHDNLDGFTHLDLPNLDPGFYLLQITHADGTFTRRIVLQ